MPFASPSLCPQQSYSVKSSIRAWGKSVSSERTKLGTCIVAVSQIRSQRTSPYSCASIFRWPMIAAHGISVCVDWNFGETRRAASPITSKPRSIAICVAQSYW